MGVGTPGERARLLRRLGFADPSAAAAYRERTEVARRAYTEALR